MFMILTELIKRVLSLEFFPVPEEIPKISDKRLIRTNSTATVFWEPVEVCTGFFNSYHYQLSLVSTPYYVKVS